MLDFRRLGTIPIGTSGIFDSSASPFCLLSIVDPEGHACFKCVSFLLVTGVLLSPILYVFGDTSLRRGRT